MVSPGISKWNLGRRIVALMILGNLMLAILATGIQLFQSYDRGRKEVLSTFETVESSFRNGLAVALWKFNFEQVDALLRGISAKTDVQFLSLVADSGHTWQWGDVSGVSDAKRQIQLLFQHDDGGTRMVGELTVGLSYEQLRRRIREQFVTLALSNFIKTLLASVIMLLIFDRVVARHLRSISAQLSASDLLRGDKIALDRPTPDEPDELDQITDALNRAKAGVVTAYGELSSAHSNLQDANREQSEFTYAISHDLKSPTNTIQMLLDEISVSEHERLSEDGTIMIADAKRTAGRMRKLIDDVLSYARAVGADTEVEDLDLDQIVDGILEDLNAEISESNARIEVGAMPRLRANALQIRLLLQNLISNAIKFVEPGKVPEVTIEATENVAKDQIVINIADRGIGIPDKFQERVFGMFQKLHSESKFPGSGLGLTLCSRVVSNHGGSLSVKSRPGAGSVFTIVLPRGMDD